MAELSASGAYYATRDLLAAAAKERGDMRDPPKSPRIGRGRITRQPLDSGAIPRGSPPAKNPSRREADGSATRNKKQ